MKKFPIIIGVAIILAVCLVKFAFFSEPSHASDQTIQIINGLTEEEKDLINPYLELFHSMSIEESEEFSKLSEKLIKDFQIHLTGLNVNADNAAKKAIEEMKKSSITTLFKRSILLELDKILGEAMNLEENGKKDEVLKITNKLKKLPCKLSKEEQNEYIYVASKEVSYITALVQYYIRKLSPA